MFDRKVCFLSNVKGRTMDRGEQSARRTLPSAVAVSPTYGPENFPAVKEAVAWSQSVRRNEPLNIDVPAGLQARPALRLPFADTCRLGPVLWTRLLRPRLWPTGLPRQLLREAFQSCCHPVQPFECHAAADAKVR